MVGRGTVSHAAWLACMIMLWSGASACGDKGKRPLGGSCEQGEQCLSGACLEGLCVDPDADQDQDGLTNGLEIALGSDGGLSDTDSDGILDPTELGDGFALMDTDGDGKADIVESAIVDTDGDCIPDQYDADDGAPSDDKSPMIPVVCSLKGLCGEQRALLQAACPGGVGAVCVYAGVVGYAAEEVACDGVDEDCDGTVDDVPGGCATGQPFITPGSGGRVVATSKYRATLVVGGPALGAPATAKHKVILGGNPVLAPDSGRTER